MWTLKLIVETIKIKKRNKNRRQDDKREQKIHHWLDALFVLVKGLKAGHRLRVKNVWMFWKEGIY